MYGLCGLCVHPELPHWQGGCLACWSCKIDSLLSWELQRFILCMTSSGGTAHEGGGCDLSIWSTVSDQGLLQLQAWVSTKWSPINSSFSTIILTFHQHSVSNIHFYHAILQDSICRHIGLKCRWPCSDPIVRCWLWSTATRSSPLGYFSILLLVIDNWPHILW